MILTEIKERMRQGCTAINNNFQTIKQALHDIMYVESFPVVTVNTPDGGGNIIKLHVLNYDVYLINLAFKAVSNDNYMTYYRFNKPWQSSQKLIAIDGTNTHVGAGFMDFDTPGYIRYYNVWSDSKDVKGDYIRSNGVIIDKL